MIIIKSCFITPGDNVQKNKKKTHQLPPRTNCHPQQIILKLYTQSNMAGMQRIIYRTFVPIPGHFTNNIMLQRVKNKDLPERDDCWLHTSWWHVNSTIAGIRSRNDRQLLIAPSQNLKIVFRSDPPSEAQKFLKNRTLSFWESFFLY